MSNSVLIRLKNDRIVNKYSISTNTYPIIDQIIKG